MQSSLVWVAGSLHQEDQMGQGLHLPLFHFSPLFDLVSDRRRKAFGSNKADADTMAYNGANRWQNGYPMLGTLSKASG